MASPETDIWQALRGRINSLPMGFSKAWPGEGFSPPSEEGVLLPYLRIGRVSVDPVPMFIEDGKRHTRTGTLIITLVYPLLSLSSEWEGRHTDIYDEWSGNIAAHFPEGTQMYHDGVCVKVTASPHVQPGYEDNGYWTVPVSIPWRTFA